MITKTSLKHPSTLAALDAAMHKAIKTTLNVPLRNKRGKVWGGVVYMRGPLAWQALGQRSGFFWYSGTEDITDIVAEVLREVGHDQQKTH